MGTALRVLVADDHAMNRLLLKTIFECFGCSVTAVENGAEALAAEGGFDLVFLDRHMPVMGGPAAAAMRGRAYMVACTSDPGGDLSDFHMVLPKPISCEDVARAIGAARLWQVCCAAEGWGRADAMRAGRRLADLLRRDADQAREVRRVLAAAHLPGARPVRLVA